jgi:hypothetical protein
MKKESKKKNVLIITCVFVILLVVSISNAFAIEISWNTVTAEGSYPITGYKLYYGTVSGNFTKSFNVYNTTSYNLSNITPALIEGQQYFFVVVAYTSIGEEGFFSDEIATTYTQDDYLEQYSLTIEVIGDGTVSPTFGTYNAGTAVMISASPGDGYAVKKWEGTNNDNSLSNTNTVTMNSNKTVSVEFVIPDPENLKISSTTN